MAYIDRKWAHSSAKGLVSLMMQQLPMLEGSWSPLTLKLFLCIGNLESTLGHLGRSGQVVVKTLEKVETILWPEGVGVWR